MRGVQIIWDLPDEPDGNYVHILDGHDVTIEEVEEVLTDPDSDDAVSRSSGNPCVFGWTSTGKYIIVVYELVLDDPKTLYPITAYPVPPP
jgi:hypothetical protein